MLGKGNKSSGFNEMRETRTGFGAKLKKDYSPGEAAVEGGLQPDDEEDEDVDEDEDDEVEEGNEVEEDEEEGSDHNF